MAMHLTRQGCIHVSLPPSIWSIIYHRLTYARRLKQSADTYYLAQHLLQCPFRTLVSTKRATKRATQRVARAPPSRHKCLYTSDSLVHSDKGVS